MINTSRCEARIKTTKALLAKSPDDAALKARLEAQEKALEKQEAAYPKLLMAHLKKCSQNGQVDIKNRTKKQAKDLLAGIPIPAKVGTGNG